jgi:hypothetical protein
MKNINALWKCLGGTVLALSSAAPIVASAQSLDGAWIAHITVNGQPCTIKTVMNSGNYSEVLQCGSLMTYQSGTYVVSGNLIVRNVIDWAPKGRYVVEGRPLGYDYNCPPGSYRTPDGHCPGLYGGPGNHYPLGPGGHNETNAKPPGGSFQVTFTSNDSMRWYDVNFHGTANFRRVR